MCVTSHLIHSQHGSGFTEERESDAVTEHWNRDLLSGGAESSEWKAWSGELRETFMSRLSRERERSSQTSDCSPSSGSNVGSTACQQTMSTPEEQVTIAVQQLYVRLQHFQETLATILQAARNERVEQVQNATSTTTLRSYLGTVAQRKELESTMTEESSTPRLNMTLSTQMYYILVMTKTLYRCHNAGVNEGFAGW